MRKARIHHDRTSIIRIDLLPATDHHYEVRRFHVILGKHPFELKPYTLICVGFATNLDYGPPHGKLVFRKRGRSPLMQGMTAHFETFPNDFFRGRTPRQKLSLKFGKAVFHHLAKTDHFTTPRRHPPNLSEGFAITVRPGIFFRHPHVSGISQIAKLRCRSGKRTPQKHCFRVCAKIKRHQKIMKHNPRHNDSVY